MVFGGRGEVTGDVVRSGVEFVDEGGKIQLVRRGMVILSLGLLKPCRPAAHKPLLTTEMLEFSGIGLTK